MYLNKYNFFENLRLPNLFTSKICGGFVDYANPQNIYFSLKQIIFNFSKVNYFFSIFFFIYASIGFIGCFFLLNSFFKINYHLSTIGSYLFAFNGFFISRYLIGHITFLEFVFLPAYIGLIILSSVAIQKFKRRFNLIVSSILIAYMVYCGSISILPYFILSSFALIFLYLNLTGINFRIILNLFLSIIFGILLSAHKIYLTILLFLNNPRDLEFYEFSSFFKFIITIINGLLGFPNLIDSKNAVQGTYRVEWHEFNFSVGFIVLILLIVSLKNSIFFKKFLPSFIAILITIFIIYLGSSSETFNQLFFINQISLIPWRLISMLILPLIVVSIVGAEKIVGLYDKKFYISKFFLSVFIFFQFTTTLSSFEGRYSIIDSSLININKTVDSIGAIVNKNNNNLKFPLDRNEFIFSNISLLNCYEPIHGYRNEKMNLQNFNFANIQELKEARIFIGDPYFVNGNFLNFFNPSCFLFPKENNCQPYDRFKINEKSELEKFLVNNDYNYLEPPFNKFLKYTSLLFLISAIFYLIIQFIVQIKKFKFF